MRKKMRGFTFIETILYLALFSILGTALFGFSWDVITLREQGRTERQLVDEARFVMERVKYLLRNSSVDVPSSVWNSANGRLVFDVVGGSDTVTISLQGGRVVMQQSGGAVIPLQATDSRTTVLRFERAYSADNSSQAIDVTVTMDTSTSTRPEYTSSITLQSGIFVRNFGL